MSFSVQTYQSPVGLLYLVGRDSYLCSVTFHELWPQFKAHFTPLDDMETPILRETKRQLGEYFAGKRQRFELALDWQVTGTAFQKRVWASLQQVPFGETRTYKQQAISIQAPTASRAVGRANGLNPLGIVLPCHRIVGSNGALTGYTGGLEIKKFLLDLEATRCLQE